MKSVFASLTILISTLVVSVCGKYADKVIASEVPLATKVDNFVERYVKETMQLVAPTTNDTVVVQSQFPNGTIGIRAFFTHTEELDTFVDSIANISYQASIASGTGRTLEEIKAYRFDVDNLPKRTYPPSRSAFESRNDERLGKREAVCQGECSSNCPDGCDHCFTQFYGQSGTCTSI